MRPNTTPNNPENMPSSDAIEDGLTDNSLDGSSRADMRKGFSAVDGPVGVEDEIADALERNAPMGGFVGRAKGSER